ncbi:hypothetical protein GCM10009122_47690 [Fulvivirga kasyanovii]|uniref:pinensin family lanthipeptide n=1 Tax=Fulvivirga kasyanovii TaxID=396812 RepID=UPI0012BBF3AC|nr:pinensin family lanthipeptide [Fulvivirga kasyanovii]
MKNKKLSLTDLKVKSFVTKFEEGVENTLKGGNDPEYKTVYGVCYSMYQTYCC